jgi:Carboxypeptidase regulatory-like domain
MTCCTGMRAAFRSACAGLLLGAVVCAFPGLARRPGGVPQAPAASISGKVEVASGAGGASGLAGITVTLRVSSPGAAAAQTAVTDGEGRYQFAHLPAANYTLGITADGFKPWTASIALAAGQSAVQDALLQINSVEQNMEVTGEATEVATQSVSANATVTHQQLENLPLKTGKFTDALSVSPSVIQTQEGRLNFNGQAESQGMLLVDSMENMDPVSGSFAVPIPVGAIQSVKVFSTPDSVAYGGFSGGLTKIEIKPPVPDWNMKAFDFIPSFRAKNAHLVGIANFTPRLEFGGPLIKDKFNFSEEMTYEFRRDPIHGLSWPLNETITHSFLSYSDFQWIFSPKHILTFNVNYFPTTNLFANINTLIPQVASVNYHRRGVSLGFADDYQFDSGAVLITAVHYLNFYSNAEGQGNAGMTISPAGWDGNFFNAWWRNANQLEILPALQLPAKSWHGSHDFRFGADVLSRSYRSSNVSHPIELLDANSNVAETITFQGAGYLHAADTEISEYAEDRWAMTHNLSMNLGVRSTSQSTSRRYSLAPRAGLAAALLGGKIVLRGGAGLIYGHVPLLSADLAGYQNRTVTFASGPFANQPIPLENTYLPPGLNSAGPDDPGNSPRTVTWNAGAESEIRRNLSVRLTYYETHTVNLFIVNPRLPAPGEAPAGFLVMQNTGTSNYRQAQISVHYRRGDRAEANVSYAWSQARGDLNSLSDTFLPF